jgi:exopolysaccharide production protein ExoZ
LEILSVQYLRGIAALMIVFLHLDLQLERLGYHGYWPSWLSAGVDIFFVISGFIMWITTAHGMSTREFFRRRFFRIVPLYWILTSVVLITLFVFPNAVQSGRIDMWHVLGSYLFFPIVHPVLGIMQPLLVPGWTLNYEVFFYIIFGFALNLPANSRLIIVSLILVGLSSVALVINIRPLTVLEFYTFSRILEFAFGMALGWIYIRGIKVPQAMGWASLLLGIGAIILTADSFEDRGLRVGIPALLVVAGAVIIERASVAQHVRALHFLGNASYSLYLSHPIVLSFLGQVGRRFQLGALPGATFFFGSVSVASAIAAAGLIYLYIEMPLLRLGRLQIFRSTLPQVNPTLTT